MLGSLTREEPRDRRHPRQSIHRRGLRPLPPPHSHRRGFRPLPPPLCRLAAIDRTGIVALREGWPVLLSVAVIGIPFGVLARQAGLDILQTSGMSVLLFAGAAQFAAIELLRAGTSPVVVAVTALLINLRHLPMGASLRPHFGSRPLLQRLGLAYLLTDEAFAMGIGWYRRGGSGVGYYVVFGGALWASWN
ncbi:MAG: AzlC family ABC transporter permease, partial [Chloroflexota bacterium]